MEKTILESTKYVSNLYFFIGSSFFIPLSMSASDWFLKSSCDFNIDIKAILRIFLAIIGLWIIRTGCRVLAVEEELNDIG